MRKRIFGLKRDEVTMGCSEWHNMKLRNLYHSHIIINITTTTIIIIIKDDEVGTTCNTHGWNEKWAQHFSRKSIRGRNHLRALGIDRIILKYMVKNMCVRMLSWLHYLRIWYLVNTGIILCLPSRAGSLLTVSMTIDFSDGFSSTGFDIALS
jgi:hypothetical protein